MQTIKHPLQSASPGTERDITSYHFTGTTDRRIYVQAALHGDELPGMATAWYLKRQFAALETAGALRASITLVPVANPIALGQFSHGSPQIRGTPGRQVNAAMKPRRQPGFWLPYRHDGPPV